MSHMIVGRAKRAEEKSTPRTGSETTLTAHGDGTYHTQSGYDSESRVDHASIGAALMHIASQHSDGDHHHVHAHDTGYTTHHVKEGGKVEGPHEHKTLGAVKKQLTKSDDDGDEAAED